MDNNPVYFRELQYPKTGYYVYMIYLDGRANPCYVGKGRGYRVRDYFYYPHKVSNRILRKKLSDLKEDPNGFRVRIAFETMDEQEALDVESFYINFYGRLIDGSGILYNFKLEDDPRSGAAPARRKPVYCEGFVFDSVGRMKGLTGIKHETFQSRIKEGRAAYLTEESQVEAVLEKEKKDKYRHFYRRHKKAIKRAIHYDRVSQSKIGDKNYWWGKTTKVAKSITIDGVTYESQSKAAKEFGYVRGCSLMKYLKRGNHNHTYEVHD